MEKLLLSQINSFVNGKLFGEDKFVNEITTDSRKVNEDTLFIGIKGERFDGNDFCSDVIRLGACAITNKNIDADGSYILVNDTKKALKDLACHYKDLFNVKVVGITGSVGKTTTKEMVYKALSSSFNTHKTMGNFNNEIGLPLSVMQLNKSYQCGVFEMGMSGFGEISALTKIARPDIAVITNIGVSHIEKLGSRENILKAKLEILEGLNKNGTVVLNGDDDLLWSLNKRLPFKTIYFGLDNKKSDALAEIITSDEEKQIINVKINNKDYVINLPMIGKHNALNAACAMSVCSAFNLDLKKAADFLSKVENTGWRQKIIKRSGRIVIEDFYNASPDSIKASLSVLPDLTANKKIVVLGDMLELGEKSRELHKNVGQLVNSEVVDILVAVGDNAKYYVDGALEKGMNKENCHYFKNNEEAANFLVYNLNKKDLVLLKASRGMKFEEICDKMYGEWEKI